MAGKGKAATVKLDPVEEPFGRRRLRDVLFIGVGAICLFVLMALLTIAIVIPAGLQAEPVLQSPISAALLEHSLPISCSLLLVPPPI